MEYSEESIYYYEALNDDGDDDYVNDVVRGVLTKRTHHGNFVPWQILALVIFPWLRLCVFCNFKIHPMSQPPSDLLQPSSHGLAGDELTVAETDWSDDDEHDEIGLDNDDNNNNTDDEDNDNNVDVEVIIITEDEEDDDDNEIEIEKHFGKPILQYQ
jgi:hypothetical protein